MPVATIATPTTQLAELATRLFGEEWAGALSRFTGINLRNCQRAKAAADAGEEERRAGAILAGLVRALDALTPLVHEALDDEGADDRPNPFATTLIDGHAGVVLIMDQRTSERLYALLHRAADYPGEFTERLLLPLAYDLRKAREPRAGTASERPPERPATVTVRALWPMLLFQLKLLRTTCAYIAITPSEAVLLDNLEAATFDAVHEAYDTREEAEDLIEAWYELGVDPLSESFEEDALARAAWFIKASAAQRRETLVHLVESLHTLYNYAEQKEGRPSLREFERWRGQWPGWS